MELLESGTLCSMFDFDFRLRRPVGASCDHIHDMMHYALSSIQIYIGMGPSVSVSVSELGSLESKSPRRGAEHVLGNGSWERGREGGREGEVIGRHLWQWAPRSVIIIERQPEPACTPTAGCLLLLDLARCPLYQKERCPPYTCLRNVPTHASAGGQGHIRIRYIAIRQNRLCRLRT